MLYSTGYASTYDFYSIWNIRDGYTLGYLLNLDVTSKVNRENINYQAYQIEGRGTENNPYIIKNAVQLQKINENLSAYYKLSNDIDLTGIEWKAIGDDKYKFTGVFDGNGHILKNLNLQTEKTNQGLFGYNAGVIKNLIIENATIVGGNNTAAFVGYNEGTITNCNLVESNITGNSGVGALAGTSTGIINTSTSSGNVQGIENIGGLIGIVSGNVSESISEATVSGNNQVGGFAGYLYSNNKEIKIENSNAKGKVTGITNVGGFVGYDFIYNTDISNKTYSSYIKKCYASRRSNWNRKQYRRSSWISKSKCICK